MTPEKFARVRDLLLEATSVPEQKRSAWIRRRASDDLEIEAAVLRLLAHDDPRDPSLHLDAIDDGIDDGAASPEAASTETLSRLGRYRILGTLGAGGMGIVYLAVDPDLGREVAVKVLPDLLSAFPFAVERFRQEARALARLNHPNIATLFSLERDDEGHIFLTMERIPGVTLAERMESGPIPLEQFLPIARQLASALEAAHASGVIHRDLKPANLLLTEEGLLKVLDFGIAKLITAPTAGGTIRGFEAEEAPPGAGSVPTGPAGTPGYMSPEQIRGEPADAPADIWSFGCILHECLTGSPAFPGSTADRLRATVDEEYDAGRLPADLPAPLRDLLPRLLARDPAARPASITEARRILDRLCEASDARDVRASARSTGEPGEPGEPGRPDRSGLPVYLTRFLGRTREIEALEERLAGSRVVSLTGIGGSGKTRLAVEVAVRCANRYPDGVRFVDLATLRDPALLPQKLAVSLRVPRAAGRSDTDRLIEGLRDKRLLLLLDNAEHMVSACADLAWKLLRACPGLSILTTTREALSIEGESVLRLGRLDDHGEETATALFLDRARARDPAFSEDADALAVVGRICHRLDGIPLAIELAATWADVLAPGEILARLEQRLALLDRTGGPGSTDATATDPRHTGLRAMIDWSHDRLSEEERALFRRLSVFHGGWSLETAEQVCLRPDQAGWGSLDRMRSLLAKSVIERVPSAERPGTSRYRMLETFREYAEEKLREAGEEAEFLKRRFEAFHRIFEARRLVGPEQTDWIARFREEEDNLRATLAARHTSAIAPSDAAAFGLKLTGFWIRLGRWEEGRRTLASLLVELREAGDGRTRLYGAVAHSCAELARSQGDLEAASSLAREALAIATEFGDDRLQSSCHNELGNVAKLLEDFESARRSYDACLAHLDPGSDPWHYAGVVFNRGVAFAEQGRFAEAEADFRESLRVKQEIGDERGVAHVLNGLGLIRKEMGAFDEARALLEESLEHKRKIDDRPGILLTLLNLGNLENNICAQPRTERERLDRAVDRFSEGLALARAIGDRSGEARLLGGLGFTRFLQGDLAAARLTLEESLAISASSSGGISGRTAQLGLAFVALEERRLDDARRHAIEALRESPRLRRDVAAQPLDLLAFVADASGSPREALRLVALARRLREGVPRGDARWESGWRADLERRILEAVGRQAFDEAVESAPVLSVEELLVRLDSASS